MKRSEAGAALGLLVLGPTELDLQAGMALGALLASVLYGAVFVTLSVMTGRALVDEVTCAAPHGLGVDPGVEETCHLAVLDFGIKRNILRSLTARGARLTVLPARTPAAKVLACDMLHSSRWCQTLRV